MIKFLRKIRYNLISTGNTGKYLKYAIGEIVLVVIGILIALQINNWNEKRIERLEEIQLLENLKVDFQQTIDELSRMNSDRGIILSANYALSKIDTSVEILNKKKIDTLLGYTFIVPTYNGKSGSLMVLLNSGKINILKNEELKKHLFSWPSEVEDMTEGEIDSKKLTNESYLPVIRKYVNVSDIMRTTTLLEVKPKKRTKGIISNHKGLLDDVQFKNLLYQLELYALDNIQETEVLIKISNSIIDIINAELHND